LKVPSFLLYHPTEVHPSQVTEEEEEMWGRAMLAQQRVSIKLNTNHRKMRYRRYVCENSQDGRDK
jgi:hypothetical protein